MFYDFINFGQGVPNETKGTINLKVEPECPYKGCVNLFHPK